MCLSRRQANHGHAHAQLVAQDPTYVTKRLSDETRESLPQAGSPPSPPSSSPPAASPPPQQQQAEEPAAPPADKPKPGSKEMWYKSETYSRLQKKLDGTVTGEARAQGGWGELPEQETPEQVPTSRNPKFDHIVWSCRTRRLAIRRLLKSCPSLFTPRITKTRFSLWNQRVVKAFRSTLNP